MANPEQLKILEQGAVIWNKWRLKNFNAEIDLSEADLRNVDLNFAYLSEANLRNADLSNAYLSKWTFTSEEGIVTVQYNWDVKTTQKVISFLALVLKPLLAWNHDEIMRWGALGLTNKLNARLIQY